MSAYNVERSLTIPPHPDHKLETSFNSIQSSCSGRGVGGLIRANLTPTTFGGALPARAARLQAKRKPPAHAPNFGAPDRLAAALCTSEAVPRGLHSCAPLALSLLNMPLPLFPDRTPLSAPPRLF